MPVVAPIRAMHGRARDLLVPLHALVELTHRCNLRCRHCYVVPDPAPELGTQEWVDALEQLADSGTLFTTFTGGEILLRDDLPEILAAARHLHFAIRLYTNATLLDDETADMIASFDPVDVGVSIYGADAATHERVTREPGSFERSVAALRRLRERGVRTRMKCVLMRQNVGQMESIWQLAETLGATAQFDPQLTPRNDGDVTAAADRLDDETLARVMQGRAERRECPADVPTCAAGREMVSISPQGVVQPCVQLPLALGDLRTASFAEVWTGAEASSFRSVTYGSLADCTRCPQASFCHPCLGLNLIETGSITRPADSVCRMARAAQKGVVS